MSSIRLETVFSDASLGSVRVFRDGKLLLFVARDILRSLGCPVGVVGGMGKRFACIPDEWKRYASIPSDRGTQRTLLVTEGGVLMYLFRSRKKKARKMAKWLAKQVLGYSGILGKA